MNFPAQRWMRTPPPFVVGALAALLCAVTAVAAEMPPRVSGVVIGPAGRLALLADRASARTLAVLSEGARYGAYTIRLIGEREVTVVGPGGIERLAVEAAEATNTSAVSNAPNLPVAVLASLDSGLMLGSLAIRRDNCVRLGFLPGAIDHEARLRNLIDEIGRVPGHEKEEGRRDAPVVAMSAAMRQGLEAARRSGGERAYDKVACDQVEAGWSRSAGRYGLR